MRQRQRSGCDAVALFFFFLSGKKIPQRHRVPLPLLLLLHREREMRERNEAFAFLCSRRLPSTLPCRRDGFVAERAIPLDAVLKRSGRGAAALAVTVKIRARRVRRRRGRRCFLFFFTAPWRKFLPRCLHVPLPLPHSEKEIRP